MSIGSSSAASTMSGVASRDSIRVGIYRLDGHRKRAGKARLPGRSACRVGRPRAGEGQGGDCEEENEQGSHVHFLGQPLAWQVELYCAAAPGAFLVAPLSRRCATRGGWSFKSPRVPGSGPATCLAATASY